jgi:hypothetical protein
MPLTNASSSCPTSPALSARKRIQGQTSKKETPFDRRLSCTDVDFARQNESIKTSYRSRPSLSGPLPITTIPEVRSEAQLDGDSEAKSIVRQDTQLHEQSDDPSQPSSGLLTSAVDTSLMYSNTNPLFDNSSEYVRVQTLQQGRQDEQDRHDKQDRQDKKDRQTR